MRTAMPGCLAIASEVTQATEAADARVQAVLQKLDAGTRVTVAAVGGSITTGYAADPPRQRGWAALVAAWLGRRGTVRLVNAAVSGTDSAVAAQRARRHVLDAQPDLVLVEFGVNDQALDARLRGHGWATIWSPAPTWCTCA